MLVSAIGKLNSVNSNVPHKNAFKGDKNYDVEKCKPRMEEKETLFKTNDVQKTLDVLV